MILMAAEDLVQVKQHAFLVIPFTAVDQRYLMQPHEKNPPCRLVEIGKQHTCIFLTGGAVLAGAVFDGAFQNACLRTIGQAHQNLQARSPIGIIDLIVDRNRLP